MDVRHEESYSRVQQLLSTGRLDEAEAICRECMSWEGSPFYFPLTLARIQWVRGRHREAAALLGRLARELNDAMSLVRVGDVYKLLGRRPQSLRCYRKALRVEPRALAPHQKLYEHHRECGEPDRAAHHLEAVLARFPGSQWGRQERAARCFEEGRWAEALALYERLPGAYAAWSCGEIHLRQGDDGQARAWFERAVERGAETPWPLYRLSLLDGRAGRLAEALVRLDEAPRGPWGLADHRARLHEAVGHREEAHEIRAASLPDPRLYPLYRERLQALADGRCILHAFRDRHGWTRVRIRPVLYLRAEGEGESAWTAFRERAGELVDRVATFLRREFRASGRVEVDPFEERSGPRPYGFFEDAIAHETMAAMCRELGVRRRRPHEALLMLWWDPASREPLSRGFGGYGHAAAECVWADAYLATVTAHELAHAILALMHTDGEKEELDAAGLMGWPGGHNRLEDTFIQFRQRAHCATFPRAQAAVRRGYRHEKKGRWDEAAREYAVALEMDPLHLWASSRLALVATHRGRYREAQRLLEQRMAMDPSPGTSAQLAQVLLDLGHRGQARVVLQATRGYGSSERTHWLVGAAWARSWHFHEALREFRRALSLNPSSLLSLVHLACTHHLMGHLGTARRLYERALRADPLWSDVHDNMALLEAEEGRFTEARRWLRRAGSLKAEEAGHLFTTARVRALEGRWGAMPRLLDRALEREPFTVMYQFWRGYACLMAGRREEARADFATCASTERLCPWGRMARIWGALLDGLDVRRYGPEIRRLRRRHPWLLPLLHLAQVTGVRDLPPRQGADT